MRFVNASIIEGQGDFKEYKIDVSLEVYIFNTHRYISVLKTEESSLKGTRFEEEVDYSDQIKDLTELIRQIETGE